MRRLETSNEFLKVNSQRTVYLIPALVIMATMSLAARSGAFSEPARIAVEFLHLFHLSHRAGEAVAGALVHDKTECSYVQTQDAELYGALCTVPLSREKALEFLIEVKAIDQAAIELINEHLGKYDPRLAIALDQACGGAVTRLAVRGECRVEVPIPTTELLVDNPNKVMKGHSD